MRGIKCCKFCDDSVRHVGCHADCEQYLEEKSLMAEEKEIVKKKREHDKILEDIKFSGIRRMTKQEKR